MPEEPDSDSEIAAIERLVALVESRQLTELVVEEGGREIRIRGIRRSAHPFARGSAPSLPEAAAMTPKHVAAIPGASTERVAISSPTVGVFYRSGGPDMPNYIEIGDHVDAGQTIGLLEAMKVFSEIPAERGGTVTEIPATNGQLVRSGEPLVYLRPDASQA